MSDMQTARDPRREVVAWLASENIVTEIRRALPDHVPVDWFLRLAQTAILMNPDLAAADKPSLLRELVSVAQLGLVLDPQMGEAWLIIDRHKKVQRRVGYQGLRKLALQSGQVTALNAQAVYENDRCEISLGDAPSVKHVIDIHAADRGKVIGCYSVGKVEGTNEPVVEWMSWRQIEQHRDRYSQAGKSGPWGDPLAEIEMGRKTVFRRLCKWLPKSPLLAEALANEDRIDDMRDITPGVGELPAPEDPRPSALHVIAQRNAPPPAEPKGAAEADAAVAEKRASRRAAAAPQQATAPEPAQDSPQEASPAGGAVTAPQSASLFEATVGGEVYREPAAAKDALIGLIKQSPAPGKLIDEYAAVLDVLDNKLANKVLDAIGIRNNELTRQHEAAERARLATKERPPEPASEARPVAAEHPEPAAGPAPGGADDIPPWVATEEPPASGPTYELKDALGKPVGEPLSAGDFLGMLQYRVDDATTDDARRLRIHNRREVTRIIDENEGSELAALARSLLP